MHRHRSPRRAAKGRAQGSYSAQQALTSRYRRGSLRSAAKRGVRDFHPETRAALMAAFGQCLEGQQKVHHLRGAQGAHGWSGRPFGARFLPTRVCPARAERRGAWTWHTSEMLDLWIKFGGYNQLALSCRHRSISRRASPTCTPANHSRSPTPLVRSRASQRTDGDIRQDGAGCSPRAHRGPWAAASPSRRRAAPQALSI